MSALGLKPSAINGEQDPRARRWFQRNARTTIIMIIIGIGLAIVASPALYRALGPRTLTVDLAVVVAAANYGSWRQLLRAAEKPRQPVESALQVVLTVILGALLAAPFVLVFHLWLPALHSWWARGPVIVVPCAIGYWLSAMSIETAPGLAAGAAIISYVWWPGDFGGMACSVLPFLFGYLNAPTVPLPLSGFLVSSRWSYARSLAFAILPAVFVLTHPVGWPIRATGLLVTVCCLLRIWRLDRMIRSFRTGALIAMARRVTLIPLLAATVLGTWARDAMAANPVAAAVTVVVVITVTQRLGWLIRLARLPALPRGLMTEPVVWFTQWGMFVFYCAAVLRTDTRVTAVVVAAVVTGCWFELSDPVITRKAQLVALMVMSGKGRLFDWSWWVRDRILAPRRPDLELVRLLMNEGFGTASVGPFDADYIDYLVPFGNIPRDASTAEQWFDLAAEAMIVVDKILPELHETRREPIRRALALQAAAFTHRKASLYQLQHRLDEALFLWIAAEELWTAAGRPMNATHAQVIEASLLTRLGMHAAAQEATAEVLAQPDLNAVYRAMALRGMSLLDLFAGDLDASRAHAAEAHAVRLPATDLRAIMRAAEPVTGTRITRRLPAWFLRRSMRRMLRMMDLAVSKHDESLVTVRRPQTNNPSRDLFTRATSLSREGRAGKSARVAVRGLQNARKTGQASFEALILELLISLTPSGRPAEKFALILEALDARERTREELLSADSRISVGGASLDSLSESGLSLLSGSDGIQDWRTKAFELTERVRARQLLEMIGSETRAPADDSLLTHETESYFQYRHMLDAFDDGDPSALLKTRAARLALGDTWRELEGIDPELADYVQLRRGAPLTYKQVQELLSSNEDRTGAP